MIVVTIHSFRSAVIGLLFSLVGSGVTVAQNRRPANEETKIVVDTLQGVVRDSLYNRPIQGAEVTLSLDTTAPRGSTARAITDTAGLFLLSNIPPGTYLLQIRRLGYARRSLPLHVIPGTQNSVTVQMMPVAVCLGDCPPDSALVAVNRKRRSSWICYVGKTDEIEAERLSWARSLIVLDSLGEQRIFTRGRLPHDSASITRMIQHVTDSKLCRRAGIAYDAHRAAVKPKFLVFKAGRLWLVQEGLGSGQIIFDSRFRYLMGLVQE